MHLTGDACVIHEVCECDAICSHKRRRFYLSKAQAMAKWNNTFAFRFFSSSSSRLRQDFRKPADLLDLYKDKAADSSSRHHAPTVLGRMNRQLILLTDRIIGLCQPVVTLRLGVISQDTVQCQHQSVSDRLCSLCSSASVSAALPLALAPVINVNTQSQVKSLIFDSLSALINQPTYIARVLLQGLSQDTLQ